MATHSKGPWRVDDFDAGTITTQDGSTQIAAVLTVDDFPCLEDDDLAAVGIECQMNMRLVAAGPDLLAASRQTLDWIDGAIAAGLTVTGDLRASRNALMAAIAAAEARS
jgi:hypothetical protein